MLIDSTDICGDMARYKKNGKFITLYLEMDAIEALNECAATSGMSKTAIVERAVKQYVQKLDKLQEMMSDLSDKDKHGEDK